MGCFKKACLNIGQEEERGEKTSVAKRIKDYRVKPMEIGKKKK